MDPLNWILITWLAMAGFIFFVVQKVIEFWPVDASLQSQQHQQQTITGDKQQHSVGSSNVAAPILGYSSYSQPQPQPQLTHHQPQQSFRSMESVEWLNEFMSWLFHHYKGSPDFLNSWLKSMNDAAKKVAPLVRTRVVKF